MEGYVFVSWRYNGEEISVDPEISIVVGGETKGTYTAYYEPIVYSIKKETSSNGTFYISHSPNVGNEDGTNSGIINDTVYLNVVPVEGYELSKAYYIVEGDIKQHLITDNKFTMPAGNVKIFVEFKLKEYNIQKVSENGNFTVSGKTTMGEKITIQPVANIGYEFDNAYYINANDGKKYTIKDNSFVMPASDITIYVEFKFIDYVITSGASANGTFTVSGTPNIGQTITINPQPSAGYKFARAYYVESGSEDKKYITGTTFTMPANNITVYVEFELIVYTISKGQNVGGDFTYSGTPTIGQTITIANITPSEGYKVGKVYYKINGTGAEIEISDNSFVMPANNVTIGIHFVAIDYTISKAPTINGDFSFSGTPNVGQTITITPQPNTGFRVDSVVVTAENKGKIDVVNNGETYNFTMPADNVTINVSFVNIVYNITTNDSQNGSYTIEGNKTTAIYAEEIKLNITPELGYKVSTAYFVDSQNKRTELDIADIESGNLTFTMPSNNISIFVEFVEIDYEISSECDGGKVYVNSTSKYKETVNFSIVLNGAKLIDVKVLNSLNQEIEVTNVNANNYSFTMPADNVTIVVSVTQFAFVYASDDTLGSVEVSGGNQIGDEVTLTFNFAEGKAGEFIGWTEDDAKGWAQNSDLNLLEQDINNPLQYKYVLESYEPKTFYAVCNPIEEYSSSYINGVYSKIKYYTSGETLSISDCNFDGTNLIVPIAVNKSNNYKIINTIKKSSFSNLKNLTKIVLLKNITKIENQAFDNCFALMDIVVDPDNAVYDSRNNCNAIIETVTNTLIVGCKKTIIPDSVTSIGESAFEGCSGLTSITIPSSVTAIGESAFEGCSGLTSMSLPFVGASKNETNYTHLGYIFGAHNSSDNNKYIPSSLKEVKILESCTNIGGYAFYNCASLTSITIPNSITNIGTAAFKGCSSLTSINIPSSVTKINISAFEGCSALKTATFEENSEVTSVGSNVFRGCTSLTSITIPSSVTSMGAYVFENCSSLQIVKFEENSKLNDIGFYIFKGCESLYSVTINLDNNTAVDEFLNYFGEDISYIPESLKEVIILEGCTEIDMFAFRGFSSLTSITIPSSVTEISSSAFEGCSALKTVTFAENSKLTAIYTSAFKDCSSLTSITIPSSVTEISQYAFKGCSSLTSIIIPSSVTKIANGIFDKCGSLASIIVDENNKVYDSRENCNAIIETETNTLIYGCKSTIIPSSVTSLGSYAFSDCIGLTSITISNNITKISPYNPFKGCSSLISIIVDENNEVYDSRNNCNAIIETATNKLISGCNNTIIPSSVTSIASYAFEGYSSLTSITIPSSVTSIDERAFYDCSSLTNITIPSSVKTIGRNAFFECTNLNSVIFKDTNGWSVKNWNSSDLEPISSEELSNPETAASYLTDKYRSYDWIK